MKCNTKDRSQPYAVRTLFGWSLHGPVEGQATPEVISQFVDLEQQVERLWDIETFDEDKQSHSYEDKRVLDLWNTEIRHENGHYTLPIP